jgi:hypothetical protein
MGAMGYRKRVGFLAGLSLAQISEFSLIFVALAASLGYVGDGVVGLVTLVGLVTITLSTYLISFADPLYGRLSRWLGIFERRLPTRGQEDSSTPVDVIVYGFGRYGRHLVPELVQRGLHVLVVDWNPRGANEGPEHEHIEVVFGDAEDPEYPSFLPSIVLGSWFRRFPM